MASHDDQLVQLANKYGKPIKFSDISPALIQDYIESNCLVYCLVRERRNVQIARADEDHHESSIKLIGFAKQAFHDYDQPNHYFLHYYRFKTEYDDRPLYDLFKTYVIEDQQRWIEFSAAVVKFFSPRPVKISDPIYYRGLSWARNEYWIGIINDDHKNEDDESRASQHQLPFPPEQKQTPPTESRILKNENLMVVKLDADDYGPFMKANKAGRYNSFEVYKLGYKAFRQYMSIRNRIHQILEWNDIHALLGIPMPIKQKVLKKEKQKKVS